MSGVFFGGGRVWYSGPVFVVYLSDRSRGRRLGHKIYIGLCALGAGLLQPGLAGAIVNMDDLHFRQHEQGVSGAVSFAASERSGNTESANVSLSSQLQWNQEDYINLLVLGFDYGEADNEKNLQKSFIHLRHIRHFSESLDYEFFGQVEENEFTRLTYRWLLGAGIRYPFAESDRHIAYFGFGGFHEAEKITPLNAGDEEEIHRTGRWNTYLLSRYKINSRVKFSNTVYFQPRMADTNDRRALLVSLLSVKATDSIAMKFSVEVSRDSQPPIGVKKTDTAIQTGFEYAF